MTVQSFDVSTAPLGQVTLVEASAGTGKTFSIKHLVLRLIVEEGIALEKILVMTFTTAATAELKRRIEEHLREARDLVKGTAGKADPLLQTQLGLWESAGLTRESVLERLEAALATLDRSNILTIHSFCRRIFQRRAFSASALDEGELMTDTAGLAEQVVEDFLLTRIPDEMQSGGRGAVFFPGGKPVSAQAFVALLNKLEENPEELVPRDIVTTPGSPEDELIRRFLALSPGAFEALKKEKGLYSYNDMVKQTWCVVSAQGSGAQQSALAQSFIRAVQEDFEAVLIDEFQDTDPVQLDLVERLFFRELEAGTTPGPRDLSPAAPGAPAKRLAIRSLFFVGDPKQAIYRFRGADLQVYLMLRSRLSAGSVASLTTNFRSARPLVEALNDLFEPYDPVRGSVFLNPQLDYTPVSAHHSEAMLFSLKDGVFESVSAVEIVGGIEPMAGVKKADAQDWVVARVLELLTEAAAGALWITAPAAEAQTPPEGAVGLPPGTPVRRVHAGDIAILCRSRSEIADFRRAFSKLGVRTLARGQDDVCATREAQEIRYVLEAIQNPGHEGLLRLALATRIFGMTLSDIEALTDSAKSELRTEFLEARRLWVQIGIAAAFRDLFSHHRTTARLLSTLEGDEALTNYAHIIELLHAEGMRYRTPAGLLERFVAMMEQKKEERACRLTANRGLVEISTIHASKGLEYPIVFVSSVLSLSARPDGKSLFASSRRQQGAAVERVLKIGYPGVKDEEAQQEDEEELARLLYVAFTRARAHLALCWVMKAASAAKTDTIHGSGLKVFARMLCEAEGVQKVATRPLLDALQNWIAKEAGEVEVIDVTALPPPAPLAQMSTQTPPALTLARSRGKPVPAAWRTWSFTGLSRQVLDPGSYPRFTMKESAGRSEAQATAVPDDEIARFPRGAEPGQCLHEMFEKADFALHAREDSEGEKARQALAEACIAARLTLSGEARREAVKTAADILRHVLNAQMLPGFSLSMLAGAEKIAEMYFLISAAEGVSTAGLRRLLAAMGPEYEISNLSDNMLEGFLQGFIDLAFCADGRYWILDWKSNVCGALTRRDFTQAAIAEEMTKKHYRLQYLIYAVALRRLLKNRLGSRFSDDMVGGALYVFLRGVAPENLTDDGLAGGVYRDTVFPAVLDLLDDYLAGNINEESAVTEIRTRLAQTEEG